MNQTASGYSIRQSLSLPNVRRLLRERHGWLLAIGLAIAFAIISMFIGGMITLSPVQGAYEFELIGWSGTQSWWFYPEFLGVQPWGLVQLPWFPTLAMTLVSLGAGMGAAAGIVLLAPLLRRKNRKSGAALGGIAAGTAPAAAAFATVGACCCTSCGTAAGLVVVAATTGTSVSDLLINTWYLALFQISVVYAALLFQDRALRRSLDHCVVPKLDRYLIATSLLRLALLIAGLTWAMAMFAEWAQTDPWTAPAPIWYHWMFEHLLLSGVAISVALFPAELEAVVRRWGHRIPGLATRVLLAVAAITWGGWVAPSLVQLGLGGFFNELFGYLGLPSAWGATPPDVALGPALYFHWAFQHLLLAGFSLSLAVAPLTVLRWLNRSSEAPESQPEGPQGEPQQFGPSMPVLEATGERVTSAPSYPEKY